MCNEMDMLFYESDPWYVQWIKSSIFMNHASIIGAICRSVHR